MYKLVIADDEGKTTVVPLVRDEITIGRKEGNTIRLTERNISRRHAKLRKANGSYLVEDLSSYNGVKVNGRRIGGELSLAAGDQISIGDYQLALQLDDGATVPETTAPLITPNGADAATTMLQSPQPAGAATLPAGGLGTPALAAGPPARLVMVSQPAPGAEFALARPLTRIGRAEELDVWINHRSISREHAEITNDGGKIRIKDLGSANGVRVNARDVQQAELSPGDMLELGQVRFRFVAPGEQFVFDADRTIELDAAPPERSSRAPIFVAAGIVGLAVVGAVAVAMSGGPSSASPASITGEPGATPGPSAPTPAVPPVEGATAPVAGPSAEERVAAAVGACVTARNGGNFDLALQRAAEALAVMPSDPRALACQEGAQQDREESNAFARGVSLRDQGDLGGAYFAFEELPPESSLRGRPEVAQTMRDFAGSTLEQAQAQLASNPDEALRLAQTVQNMTQLEASTRRTADIIARRARPRISASRQRASAREPSEPREPRVSTAPATTGRVTPQISATPETGVAPLAAARACLARGDNQCAVRALDGRARTTDEYRLLIETYRAMGNSGRMLDTMERYIQRFPGDARAAQYRQILAQHGR